MLRLVATGNSLPFSYPVDPSAEFEPGMVGQLTVMGNQIVLTVSNGTAPLGIIDDIKTKAFTATSWDETVIVSIDPSNISAGKTIIDVKYELKNPNIMASSFISIPVDVELKPRNGVIVFPAGTTLNFDLDGTGSANAIKTIVRYTYQIPNIIGDDSTQGSGRATIWFQRFMFQTDKYETSANYPVNANLFVSETGLLTTRQPSANHPAIALVTGPPSALSGFLEALWL